VIIFIFEFSVFGFFVGLLFLYILFGFTVGFGADLSHENPPGSA
jgi:hypothetical protein